MRSARVPQLTKPRFNDRAIKRNPLFNERRKEKKAIKNRNKKEEKQLEKRHGIIQDGVRARPKIPVGIVLRHVLQARVAPPPRTP